MNINNLIADWMSGSLIVFKDVTERSLLGFIYNFND